MNHFRAWWPITDPHMSLDDLADEASEQMPALLRRQRLCRVGRVRWSIRHGRDLPGTGGAHLVLVADLAVVQIERAETDEEAA